MICVMFVPVCGMCVYAMCVWVVYAHTGTYVLRSEDNFQEFCPSTMGVLEIQSNSDCQTCGQVYWAFLPYVLFEAIKCGNLIPPM